MVAKVRRLTGQRKAGHAGTLDPAATGVLPVALGRATRLVEYLADARKAYDATVRLGVTTTTLDAEGEIVEERPADHLDRAAIDAALDQFRGKIEQRPPMYSALKVGGRRLYDLARRGETVERATREVEVYRLDVLGYQAPDLALAVECSKGTYIRSLADDLGRALGVGAHLAVLRRTRVGPFDLARAVTLDAVAWAAEAGNWDGIVWAADEIVADWPALVLDPVAARAICLGQSISAAPGSAGQARAYAASGEFLAIVRRSASGLEWHPVKVLATTAIQVADNPTSARE